MAALWKPGMGVYMKEPETNLFVFQFHQEVDVKESWIADRGHSTEEH